MNKFNILKINTIFSILMFYPIFLLLQDTYLNKTIAILFAVVTIYSIYLDVTKLKINDLKVSKIASRYRLFQYILYILSLIMFAVYLFNTDIEILRLAVMMYIFGLVFINQDYIYYTDDKMYYGFIIIFRKGIKDIELGKRKIEIKYRDNTTRVITLNTKAQSETLYKGLKDIVK